MSENLQPLQNNFMRLPETFAPLKAILDNVGSGICVKEKATNKVLFMNKVLKNNFSAEIKNGTIEELFSQARKPNSQADYLELYYPPKKHWYDLYYTDIAWVDGSVVSLCTVYNTTDKKLYQQKIEQQANNDFLTGLYNRMKCESDLKKYIDIMDTERNQGTLLYIDLDDFKHINDGLGHQYGDVLLQDIAHNLRRIKGIENSCYRVGGDEFIIIVGKDKYSSLNRILNDIKEIFAKPWFLKTAEYYCTFSMGVVRFPRDGDTVHELIKKADIAMYEAKKQGKNDIYYYDEDVEISSYRRLDLEKNLRYATASGCDEFIVYFQPIVDVSKEGNPCVGAEALIRWNNKHLGFISPSDFIPLAEYLGLINPIGNFVLEEACIRCKYWNDYGHPEYKVNVNLSVVQLLQNSIVDTVRTVVERTGINPNNLTLEVTESLAINDMNRMKRILSSIRELGVRIALDDFGTGYSALSHIKELPLDVIKVDQTFVKDISADDYAKSFVEMISELASTIGVKICVEGIEEETQYQLLKDMKVTLIQGYYFDKPMPVHEFEDKYLV